MKKAFFAALSVAVFIAVYQISSIAIDSPLILPSISEVVKKFFSLIKTASFHQNFWITFSRVVVSFSLSLILGSLLGLATGFSSAAKSFFSFPLAMLRSTPVVAFILILVFALPSSSVPIIASVFMTLPVAASSICTGTENFKSNEKMNEMARVFHFTRRQKLLNMLIPELKPYFKSALVSCFGMSWKVVAAGEVLSLPRHAMGTAIAQAQVNLETSEVLAYTFTLVAISWMMETVLKKICTSKKTDEKSTLPDPESYMPEIIRNERLALIAPSGFGKTTLLNYISKINGSVSYTFQEPRLMQDASVFQNVLIPLLNDFSPEEARKRAMYYIEKLNLADKKDVQAKHLSGGQAQRTALARSLAFPSEILLLDEPFNAQDYEQKIALMDFLISELDKNPRTLIFVTHDERDGKYLCKKIIRLDAQENSSSIIR